MEEFLLIDKKMEDQTYEVTIQSHTAKKIGKVMLVPGVSSSKTYVVSMKTKRSPPHLISEAAITPAYLSTSGRRAFSLSSMAMMSFPHSFSMSFG